MQSIPISAEHICKSAENPNSAPLQLESETSLQATTEVACPDESRSIAIA